MANRDSHTIFNRNLDFWLDKRGSDRASLSRYLKMDPSTATSWKTRSAPDLRTLGKIAEFLNIAIRDLFLDPDDPPLSSEAAELIITDDQALRALVRNRGLEIKDPHRK